MSIPFFSSRYGIINFAVCVCFREDAANGDSSERAPVEDDNLKPSMLSSFCAMRPVRCCAAAEESDDDIFPNVGCVAMDWYDVRMYIL